jgi:L-ascorbate metabolism protein UlaG (beta-lactamase superfamily)
VSRRAFLAGSAAAIALSSTRARAAPTSRDRITHIGNSTHLIVVNGVRVLTDPWEREPADYVLVHTAPPAAIPTDVDVVLVTHEHDDHFDESVLAKIDKRATVVVPTWLEARTRALGFADVRALKAGDVVRDVRGLKSIEAVLALHDVDEVAYRFDAGSGEDTRAFFFGGDTLPTRAIDELAIRAPVDLAILPADAGSLLGKRWVMNPSEAVALAERFGARAAKRGAMLTHHEYVAQFPWTSIVDVHNPPNPSDFPPWFRVPKPGEHISFPWQAAWSST